MRPQREVSMRDSLDNVAIEVLGSGRIWRAGQSAALAELRDDEPQPPSANVVAASVVAFADGVSGQQKEDLLNSTLLAQLAANKAFDRERDTPNWYGKYRELLHKVGWVSEKLPGPEGRPLPRGRELSAIPPSPGRMPPRGRGPVAGPGPVFPFVRLQASGPRFTAGLAAMRLLQSSVTGEELEATQSAVTRLENLGPRDRRVVIFESSSHNSGRGSFQIVSAGVSAGGALRMTIAAFFFTASEPVGRVLSFTFSSSSTEMFQSRDSLLLDDAEYQRNRDQVLQILGDQASVLIDELELNG